MNGERNNGKKKSTNFIVYLFDLLMPDAEVSINDSELSDLFL